VSDAKPSHVPTRGLLRWAREGLADLLEPLVSRRGMAILFLASATVLATAGWLRPPLSHDIRSIHLPLGTWAGAVPHAAPNDMPGGDVANRSLQHGAPDSAGDAASPSPGEILRGPRRLVPSSPGMVLLALIAVSAVVVWRSPRQLATVAGLLLAVSLAANAAVLLNHPALIELLDHEYEQRRQIADMSAESPEGNPMSPEEDPMADPYNGRIGLAGAPVADEQRGDLFRGSVYLLYGVWLVPYCGAVVLLASRGTVWWRGGQLVAWTLLGVGLACAAGERRLAADYHWYRAHCLEARCDYDGAREALDEAVARFPQLERLERTWLFRGKLDYREKRQTGPAKFFHAYQLARDRTRPRAIAYQQDLPWLIARTHDYREGLISLPSGYDLTLQPGVADVGTKDTRRGHYLPGMTTPGTPFFEAYWFAATWEPLRASFLMDELLAEGGDRFPAVRNQAGRLWANAGLHYYLRGELLTDEGLVYSEQNLRLTAAQHAWRRATELDPGRLDCSFYLGMVQARSDRNHPERADELFSPLLLESADRALRADILNVVGDAYFDAGQMEEARRRYVESFDVFNLPGVSKINYRAQRRLGGL
jgi:tetratricopeptide (TPR) repeat protein